jgi:hypothetical protein
MSTEHQQYSPENQSDVIRQYAASHNMEIVQVYSDHGRSGLNIAGREGLNQLMSDVENKQANFSALLVYDVSRWGRFQDVDESAYYEYLLKGAGIRVHYCAEQFENDGSMGTVDGSSSCRPEQGTFVGQLGFHLIPNLVGNLCQRRFIIAGLVVEDDSECADRISGCVKQDQFILEVFPRRIQLEIALSSANTTKIVFITNLPDASEVGRDDDVLVVRRLGMNRNQNDLGMFCQCLIYKFLGIGRSLGVRGIHFFRIYFSHAGNSLFSGLLG